MTKNEMKNILKEAGVNFPANATVDDLRKLMTDNNLPQEEPKQEDQHTKKIWNINEMRPVLVAAHNSGNKSAISKSDVKDLGINTAYFEKWQKDVKTLRDTVVEYLRLRESDMSNPDEVEATRNSIFPLWKSLLEGAEPDKFKRTLNVLPNYDTEALAGFALTFMHAEGKGTQMVGETDTLFRKKVESYIGCRMIGASLLSDKDRDVIKDFQSAQNRVQTNSDLADSIQSEIDALDEFAKKIPAENKMFREYISRQVKSLISDKKDAEKNIEEAKRDVNSLKDDAEKAYAKLTKAE